MSQVLIVSKTRYSDRACVGAIDLNTFAPLRLTIDDHGTYPPLSHGYEVGQIWDMTYQPSASPKPPHLEDAIVTPNKLINKSHSNIKSILLSPKLKNRLWKGHPQNLYEGCVRWTGSRNGYIAKSSGLPSVSTGFWIPDRDLTYANKHYTYNDGNYDYGLSYAGFEASIDPIPANTLVRVSLAKWWKPEDVDVELRCYLQLSGWY
ncbi:MAG: hypothetical protein JWR18_1387 [Segetibacter sp.]|nr:hypothetical protein [Segetibacter sp.]